jgi:hypothetical protein
MVQCLGGIGFDRHLRQVFIDIFVKKYKLLLLENTPNSWRNMLKNRRVNCLSRTCQYMARYNDFDGLKEYEKLVD